MRRVLIAMIAALVAVAVVAPTAAVGQVVDVQPVVEHFNLDGTVSGETIGRSVLTRSSGRLDAEVQVRGLLPGGVYTFWWVVTPEGGTFPDDTFVASGDSAVIGASGRAKALMSAVAGQQSIEGFLISGQPLDFDLQSALVRVEIAYHGQVADAGSDLKVWRSDFWTGTACPQAFGLNPGGTPGDLNAIGQPHCPVYIVAEHEGS